jgi:hypothetical protein
MQSFFRLALVAIVFYSAFPTPHSAFAAAASVQTVVKKLQTRYDSTKGFRADFTQEVESATLGQKVEARGKVFFKKPGRMRYSFGSTSPKKSKSLKLLLPKPFAQARPPRFCLGSDESRKILRRPCNRKTRRLTHCV